MAQVAMIVAIVWKPCSSCANLVRCARARFLHLPTDRPLGLRLGDQPDQAPAAFVLVATLAQRVTFGHAAEPAVRPVLRVPG